MKRHTVVVRMEEHHACRDARVVLETSSLGSCLGVALYDSTAGVAGLCHIVLDREDRFPGGKPGRCVDTAIVAVLADMIDLGAAPERVVAHLAGGGNMFRSIPRPVFDVGASNVAAAKEVLQQLGIPIVGEDVGGSSPRRLAIHVGSGQVTIRFPAGGDHP